MPSEEDRLERLYRKALAAKKPVIKDGKEYVCPHGLKVFTVDGTQIRNNLDSDFIQGSGYNFRFIPKGEIWMDYVLPISELRLPHPSRVPTGGKTAPRERS